MGIRLGVFEPGLTDGIAHAKWLDAKGIDFLDLSYGFGFEMDKEKPEDFPLADVIYGAARVREAVSAPVFAVYGIQSAEQAQLALELTDADMIDVGRGTLVNYNWPKDAQAGRDTGRCLYCPQCMWRVDPDRCAGRKLLKKTK